MLCECVNNSVHICQELMVLNTPGNKFGQCVNLFINTVDGYQELVALDTRHFWERFGQCVNLLNNTVDELPEPVVFLAVHWWTSLDCV